MSECEATVHVSAKSSLLIPTKENCTFKVGTIQPDKSVVVIYDIVDSTFWYEWEPAGAMGESENHSSSTICKKRGDGSVMVFATNFILCKERCYFGQREKRASKICCPSQRNATFILHCMVFD